MMVGDNQIDAAVARDFRLLDGGDAAVDGDDELGADIGKRDRLPYSKRFDQIVDEFNRTQPRAISPHLVWRLVATLAK